MSSAALVGTDGSVDWCCLPRFDSPSVFGALLDQDIGGRFRISPTAPCLETTQEYVQDTNVLETTFRTETGVVSIIDFMPIPDDDGDAAWISNRTIRPKFTAWSPAVPATWLCSAISSRDTTMPVSFPTSGL